MSTEISNIDLNTTDEYQAVVLLVDDQAMVGEAIRRMLENEDDMEFHFCEDPAKALETAIEVNATIILQDLVMPDIDGMTLLRFYKNHPDTKNIPVIILSSKEDAEIKSDTFANGANDYLVKLPDPIELTARIRAHTRHYLSTKQRDEAYEAMRIMQEQLAEANSQLEKHNVELQQLSSQDGLTGIANRRSFDEFLEKEWSRAIRDNNNIEISLIMIDIDFFKVYNDNYGHQAGDDCLKKVAWALDKCIHRATDLMARYGGEEFVCVLVDTPLDGAMTLAENMRKAIEDAALPHEHSKVANIVSISLGVSILTPSKENLAENLVKAADEALYEAKESGRNKAVAAKK